MKLFPPCSLRVFAACLCAALGGIARADGAGGPPAHAGPARAEGSPLVVVLDPGHGGAFPHDGAHGTKGLIEKTIALQVTKRLQADLEEAGATVLLTREDDDADVSLADRARFANEANADLFVSVHCNSMATRHDRSVTRGVESYFLSPDPTDAEARMLAELENGGPAAMPLPKSKDAVSGLLADLALGQARNDSAQLAETLHRALIHKTGAQSRGVRQAPFLVLSGTKMPSALIEIGFISHATEGRLLAKETYQQKIADALAEGIRDFAAQVLLRRLLPPTEEARAALLARRSEAAHERAARRKPNSLGHQTSAETAYPEPSDEVAGASRPVALESAAPGTSAPATSAEGTATSAPAVAPGAVPADAATLPPAPVAAPAASAAVPLAPALDTRSTPSPAPATPVEAPVANSAPPSTAPANPASQPSTASPENRGPEEKSSAPGSPTRAPPDGL